MARHKGLLAAILVAASFALAACGREPEPAGPPAEGAGKTPAGPGEVLTPPTDPFETLPSVAAGDIPARLRDAGEFRAFLKAMTKSEALYDLAGAGPFTVFAPSDDAFAALPEETVKALDKDLKRYRHVCLYHVVAGKVRAADLAGKGALVTLAGVRLPVRETAEGPSVGGAAIVMRDIEASNGLIHSIDRVLIPPEE